VVSAREMGQGEGALSRGAGMVAAARQDFGRLDQELVAHLAAARSAWSGRGGTAFHALGQAWHEKQRTIVAALDGLEAALRATEKDNVGTDELQSAAFIRQQQRLG
jgi:uncharacterized protein YukE